MAGYEQLLDVVKLRLEASFGPSLLEGYVWDPLPTSFPCTGECMVDVLLVNTPVVAGAVQTNRAFHCNALMIFPKNL